MVQFEVIPDTNIIEFVVDGKIAAGELSELLSACEKVIADHGKVRLLKEIRSIGGIEAAGLWENLTFGFRNMSNLERIAAVADKTWMENLAKLSSHLLPGEVRFFAPDQIDEARAWLRE